MDNKQKHLCTSKKFRRFIYFAIFVSLLTLSPYIFNIINWYRHLQFRRLMFPVTNPTNLLSVCFLLLGCFSFTLSTHPNHSSLIGAGFCRKFLPLKGDEPLHWRRTLAKGGFVVFSIILNLFRPTWPTSQQPTTTIGLPNQCDTGTPTASPTSLLRINQTKTLLIAAYEEHRKTAKQIRVLAVAMRSEIIDYRCLLCCQDRLYTSVGVMQIHSDHFGFVYGTADIMYPLPPGCEVPSSIAVYSAADKSEEKHFVEVKNVEKKNESFPYNFTVCFSVMYEYTNLLQLVQSLELMQLLGVNRVVLYLTSCSSDIQRVLNYYTEKGLVEVIPWSFSKYLTVSRSWQPDHAPGDLHYFGQIPALNDCVYRYMYQSKYVALHDIDEIMMPQLVDSLVELLPILEEKHGRDKCYMFQNNVFPTTIPTTPPNPHNISLQSPSWKNISGVNILAHLYYEPITSENQLMNYKIIVNPRVVFTTSVHGVLESMTGCTWVDRDVARMYHIRAARQPNMSPDVLIFDGRLLKYSSRLIPSVNTVLQENELIPKPSKD